MVDLLGMFRRRPAKRGKAGFARSREDITALGDSFGNMLTSPVRDAPPIAREAPVTGSASDPGLVERLGLQASRYEGPTGIVGVVHDACKRANIASASLWAAVPHYVSLAPSPKAAGALCVRLAELLGTDIDIEELDEAADAYVRQVSEAIASDEETAAYVEELERRVDELDEADIPSGESLAAELARFLREREEEGGNGTPGASDR